MDSINDASNNEDELNKILGRKSAGIKFFTAQKWNEAIAEFNAAILEAKAVEVKAIGEENRPKQTKILELMSNCYNNISACNEKLVPFIYDKMARKFKECCHLNLFSLELDKFISLG